MPSAARCAKTWETATSPRPDRRCKRPGSGRGRTESPPEGVGLDVVEATFRALEAILLRRRRRRIAWSARKVASTTSSPNTTPGGFLCDHGPSPGVCSDGHGRGDVAVSQVFAQRPADGIAISRHRPQLRGSSRPPDSESSRFDRRGSRDQDPDGGEGWIRGPVQPCTGSSQLTQIFDDVGGDPFAREERRHARRIAGDRFAGDPPRSRPPPARQHPRPGRPHAASSPCRNRPQRRARQPQRPSRPAYPTHGFAEVVGGEAIQWLDGLGQPQHEHHGGVGRQLGIGVVGGAKPLRYLVSGAPRTADIDDEPQGTQPKTPGRPTRVPARTLQPSIPAIAALVRSAASSVLPSCASPWTAS